MIPGLAEWKQALCEIVASGWSVQPSEFWDMDLKDLNFCREIAKILLEVQKKQAKVK